MSNIRLLLTLAVLLACNGLQAAITAPDAIEAGQLAVCKSTAPATWTVYPQEYRGSYYVADGGCTCVIASPVKGAITVMAATIDDNGGVDIAEHTLYNGEPAPDADKTDPTPAPVPAPETIESVIAAADVKATAADLNALANAFDVAAQSIANGAVTTPAGARETFRAVWLQSAAKTNPEAIDALSGLIDKLSGMVDNSSIQTIQRDYIAAAKALQTKADKLKAAPVQAKPAGGCPSGKCPLKTYKMWGA